MKIVSHSVIGVLVLAGAVASAQSQSLEQSSTPAPAQQEASAQMTAPAGHIMLTPQEVAWKPGPPSIKTGAEMAVLFGDPAKEGLFAFRLKLPQGYEIPPHHHPKPEVVTVISGTFHLGMGDSVDKSQVKALPAGSFFAFQPGEAHFAFVEEETVVQVNSTGPWGLTYIDPKDDPRQQAAR